MAEKIHSDIKKEDIKGIKIKHVNIGLLVAEFVLFAVLAGGTVKVSDGYTRLIQDTDDYMASQDSIYELEHEYDRLTAEARGYADTNGAQHLADYFEIRDKLGNDKSVKAEFVNRFGLTTGDAGDKLQEAVDLEAEVMEMELHSMKLSTESIRIVESEIPDQVAAYELPDEEKQYTSQKKMDTAKQMLYSPEYESLKRDIRSRLYEVRTWMAEYTSGQQTDSKDMLDRALYRQRILLAVLCLFFAGIYIFMIVMIIRPVYQIIRSLREEKILELRGSYELRYLASTYNDICRINTASKLELNHKANYDALTGVLNRGSFNRLCELFKGSLQPLAFLLIDVDIFKSINDNYGHEVGDQALKKVAALLKKSSREKDYTIRFGGDEFVLIMTGVTPSEKPVIGDKIDAINHTLMNPEEEGMPAFSLSVGISFSQKGYNEEIFKKADRALYFTKEHGRCGYTFYQENMTKINSCGDH